MAVVAMSRDTIARNPVTERWELVTIVNSPDGPIVEFRQARTNLRKYLRDVVTIDQQHTITTQIAYYAFLDFCDKYARQFCNAQSVAEFFNSIEDMSK